MLESAPLSANAKQLRIAVERITYRDDTSGWTVFRARGEGDEELITATGNFPVIRVGEHYEMFGTWSRHAQYGAQFKVERCVPLRPNTPDAVQKYLSSGLIKGVGDKTAAKIIEHFGRDTLDILDKDPKKIFSIPGLGRKKAEAVISSWQQQKSVADVMLFLSAQGISPLFASKIFKLYGQDAIKLVTEDPYRLAREIHGIGFTSADKIAHTMGIAKDSPERINAAIIYLLEQAEDRGHCYLLTSQLISQLLATLGLDHSTLMVKLAACLAHLTAQGAIVSEAHGVPSAEGEKETRYYHAELMTAESRMADAIARLLREPLAVDDARMDAWLNRYCETMGHGLTLLQLKAVRQAASSRVFVLTGGPGVGKTTTANAIIRLLKAMGRTVALAAPTGRAAQRLTEISAEPARTIHRLLEWVPGMHTFGRNETNPLPIQALIVDESSMLDIRLADALMAAVPKSAQVIFIGDVDQLPSVGPGQVLGDLINSGVVPFVKLDQIFRQGKDSQIILAAHAINHGEMPDFSEGGASSDCRFTHVDNVDDVKATLKDLLTRQLPAMGFDPMKDVQILTPMNRGPLGTIELNQELQAVLNPATSPHGQIKRMGFSLRRGDKVIQSANNYDLGVFNGDIGYVAEAGVDGGKALVRFGDRQVVYEGESLMDLRLAYAITIHKSQGSEFPVVLIPISMQHYIMLQRNLIYTALTRARKLANFVGAAKALNYAVRNQERLMRQTELASRLAKRMK